MPSIKDRTFGEHNYINSCTGCGACQNMCPCGAIEMCVDSIEGYKPFVVKSICIDCGRCIDVCPVLNEEKNLHFPMEGYAVAAGNSIREKSSSGGFFTVAAEKILGFGGVVYGVGWNDKLTAVHMRITRRERVEKLRYSKYVQSDTSNVFREIKKDLEEKKMVLFSGTPCQVAGLSKYIDAENINTENLYLIDLICGDAPSPALWEMFLNERYRDSSRPYDYRFRDKIHGWEVISNCLETTQDSYVDVAEDYYLKGFLENMMFRPACEECRYRKVKPGDITIGDFWKVHKYKPLIDWKKGVSTVLVNTEKGKKLLENLKDGFAVFEPVEVEKLMDGGGFRSNVNRGIECFRHQILEGYTLKSAYEAGRDLKYDIGLVGEWCNHNYGSHLTYYALKKTLEKMGFSVLLIGPPVTWWKYSRNIFGDERFRALPGIEDVAYLSLDEYDYEYLNERCGMFCVGSDTTFHEFQFFDKKKYAGLAWTDSGKGRIIYGGSFGTYDFNANKEKIEYLKYCFHRFDRISFREKAGVQLAEEVFEVASDYVLDPVFLLSAEEWRQHEICPDGMENKKFGIVFFYEDNGHDADTEKFLGELKVKYNCDFYYVTRSDSAKENAIANVRIEELLWLIDHAEMILTNSFHVTALSIIFNKLFYAINRIMQLPVRIPDILTTCDLTERMIVDYRYDEMDVENLQPIDYERVNYILNQYIRNSKNWLKDAVEKAKNKGDNGWNECDYLRRRVDELSSLVTKLSERVNELSKKEFSAIDNNLNPKPEITKDEFLRKFDIVADRSELLMKSLAKKGYKNVIVYGVGIVGKIVIDKLQELTDIKIKYLIDRKVKEYKGEKVYGEPQDLDADVVIVTVLNEDHDIRRYLKSFIREVDVLMVDDWINDIYQEIVS